MPLGPRSAGCVRPAPKSRLAVSGRLRGKIKIEIEIKIKINGNADENENEKRKLLIVPTLRVGMRGGTLCVRRGTAV
jgi:hypothetical protein